MYVCMCHTQKTMSNVFFPVDIWIHERETQVSHAYHIPNCVQFLSGTCTKIRASRHYLQSTFGHCQCYECHCDTPDSSGLHRTTSTKRINDELIQLQLLLSQITSGTFDGRMG